MKNLFSNSLVYLLCVLFAIPSQAMLPSEEDFGVFARAVHQPTDPTARIVVERVMRQLRSFRLEGKGVYNSRLSKKDPHQQQADALFTAVQNQTANPPFTGFKELLDDFTDISTNKTRLDYMDKATRLADSVPGNCDTEKMQQILWMVVMLQGKKDLCLLENALIPLTPGDPSRNWLECLFNQQSYLRTITAGLYMIPKDRRVPVLKKILQWDTAQLRTMMPQNMLHVVKVLGSPMDSQDHQDAIFTCMQRFYSPAMGGMTLYRKGRQFHKLLAANTDKANETVQRYITPQTSAADITKLGALLSQYNRKKILGITSRAVDHAHEATMPGAVTYALFEAVRDERVCNGFQHFWAIAKSAMLPEMSIGHKIEIIKLLDSSFKASDLKGPEILQNWQDMQGDALKIVDTLVNPEERLKILHMLWLDCSRDPKQDPSTDMAESLLLSKPDVRKAVAHSIHGRHSIKALRRIISAFKRVKDPMYHAERLNTLMGLEESDQYGQDFARLTWAYFYMENRGLCREDIAKDAPLLAAAFSVSHDVVARFMPAEDRKEALFQAAFKHFSQLDTADHIRDVGREVVPYIPTDGNLDTFFLPIQKIYSHKHEAQNFNQYAFKYCSKNLQILHPLDLGHLDKVRLIDHGWGKKVTHRYSDAKHLRPFITPSLTVEDAYDLMCKNALQVPSGETLDMLPLLAKLKTPYMTMHDILALEAGIRSAIRDALGHYTSEQYHAMARATHNLITLSMSPHDIQSIYQTWLRYYTSERGGTSDEIIARSLGVVERVNANMLDCEFSEEERLHRVLELIQNLEAPLTHFAYYARASRGVIRQGGRDFAGQEAITRDRTKIYDGFDALCNSPETGKLIRDNLPDRASASTVKNAAIARVREFVAQRLKYPLLASERFRLETAFKGLEFTGRRADFIPWERSKFPNLHQMVGLLYRLSNLVNPDLRPGMIYYMTQNFAQLQNIFPTLAGPYGTAGFFFDSPAGKGFVDQLWQVYQGGDHLDIAGRPVTRKQWSWIMALPYHIITPFKDSLIAADICRGRAPKATMVLEDAEASPVTLASNIGLQYLRDAFPSVDHNFATGAGFVQSPEGHKFIQDIKHKLYLLDNDATAFGTATTKWNDAQHAWLKRLQKHLPHLFARQNGSVLQHLAQQRLDQLDPMISAANMVMRGHCINLTDPDEPNKPACTDGVYLGVMRALSELNIFQEIGAAMHGVQFISCA